MEDTPGLGRLIQTLLPFLIFLFFIIVNVIAAANKKKQLPPEKSGQTDDDVPQRSLSDELKRSLEDIFGNIEQREESKPEPQPQPQLAKKAPVITKPHIDPYRKKAESPYLNIKKKFPKAEANAYALEPVLSSEEFFSSENLINAIVWSEIIQPPVSMRDELRSML